MKTIERIVTLVTLVIVAPTLVFVGCNKNKDKTAILGTWEYVYQSELEGEPAEITSYTFLPEGKMTWSFTVKAPQLADDNTIYGVGTWEIDGKNLTMNFLCMEEEEEGEEKSIEYDEYNSNYELSDEVLTIKDEFGAIEMRRIDH